MSTNNQLNGKGTNVLVVIAIAVVMLAPVTAVCQQHDPVGGEPPHDPSQGTDEDLAGKVAEQDEEIEKLREKVAELEGLEGKVEELSERFEQAEMEDLEAEFGGVGEFESSFRVYGFFDLSLISWLHDESGIAYGLVPETLSFAMTRTNIFFHSQMTEALSALIEVRFTFQPHGQEKSLNDDILGTKYERVNTRVLDQVTAEEYNLGGVLIERAHLTWLPHDAFGIIAGRFLTPYGIWNVEHGSPVLIPLVLPLFMVRGVMPSAQTGIQLLGRFFPAQQFYFNYAVTLSNGRGPNEANYDLDDNKAVGLRLRGSYEGKNANVAIGGYLFWGTVRDISKRLASYSPFTLKIEDEERYSELIGSADLLVEVFGARVQVEYVHGVRRYSVRPLRIYPFINVKSPLGQYQPDYYSWSLFALLGYEIDFETPYGFMSLIPYFIFENIVPEDSFPDVNMRVFRGGLNFKPSPFVAIKAEMSVTKPTEDDSILGEGFKTVGGQIAVSF